MTDSDTPSGSPGRGRNERVETLRAEVHDVAVPERLAAGEAKLRTAGLVLPPIGLILIVLAWYQASGTAFVAEQIPYLISGGLAGLGILTIGVGLYVRFSLAALLRFWLARLVAEHQVQTDRVSRPSDASRRGWRHSPTGATRRRCRPGRSARRRRRRPSRWWAASASTTRGAPRRAAGRCRFPWPR